MKALRDNHHPIIMALAAGTSLLTLRWKPAPTGEPQIDALISVGFVILVILAGSQASRKALIFMAALATIFIGLSTGLITALAALLGSLWLARPSSIPEPVHRIGRALVTAAAVLPLLRLAGLGFTGSPSIIAGIAIIPILFTAYRSTKGLFRRNLRIFVILFAIVMIGGSLLSAAAALSGRAAVEAGVQRATDGLDLARAGKQDEAVEQLQIASVHFRDAGETFSSWWAAPGRLVPVVAQNSRAVEVAAVQGAALSDAAVAAATTADVNQVRGRNGQLDLDLLEQVGEALIDTAITLNRAVAELDSTRSPWLLPLINNRLIAAGDQLAEAGPDINLAAHATSVLPGILGADGTRTYLAIFTNPAESREFGGFGSAYAFFEARDGKITLLESGKGGALNRPWLDQPGFDDPDTYPERYINFGSRGLINNFGNLTGTPDLPTIARASRDAMAKRDHADIDGVLIMDPFALGALLELAGQTVEVPGSDDTLTSDTVADYLLRGQYEQFRSASTAGERFETLGDIAREVFDELLSIEIPGPERIGEVMGPMAHQRRMQFTTFVDEENSFLERVFLRSSVPTVADSFEYLAVVGDTAAPNKLDAYLKREVIYDVTVEPDTGRTFSTLRVLLTNTAPEELPSYVQGFEGYYWDLPPGTQRERLSVYTKSAFQNILHNGQPTESLERWAEYGYIRDLSFIDIPRGATSEVTMEYNGSVAPGQYGVFISAQPRAFYDEVTVNVSVPDGWVVSSTGERTFSTTFTLTEDRLLTVDMRPA